VLSTLRPLCLGFGAGMLLVGMFGEPLWTVAGAVLLAAALLRS
jgi:hypothetical protein